MGEGDILEGHDANDIGARLINGWDNVWDVRVRDHDKPKETMIKWVVKMFPEYHDKATSLQENDNKVQCMEWNLDKRGRRRRI